MKRTPVYPIEAPERYFCRLLCIFVLWGWPCHLLAGMPSSAPPGPQQVPQRTGGQGGGHPFPPVLKTELPSDHILKYMDGLTKKSLKISDSQLTKLNLWGNGTSCQRICMGTWCFFPRLTDDLAYKLPLRNWRESMKLSRLVTEPWPILGSSLACFVFRLCGLWPLELDQPIHAVARFIGKLDLKIKELDQLHGGINDVFGSGAVEGYSEKQLDSTTLAKKNIGCHGASIWFEWDCIRGFSFGP